MTEGSSPARRPAAPIPLNVLTGFLGAGKTSLLNRLLKDPVLSDTAVLINEFGDVGLDHLLVERVDDGLVMLTTGCLCCTVRGDLVDARERLLRALDNNRAVFRRVVVETTGLADPAPVLHTVMLHPYLVMRYRLDGVVTLVDGVNGLETLDSHPEAVKQAAVADRLVLTKADLLDTPERRAGADELRSRLRALNPAAPILNVGEATPRILFDCGLFDPTRKIPDVGRWLAAEAYATTDGHHHHHHDRNRHDDRIRAFSIVSDAALTASTLDMFIDLLRSLHGPNLLRLKGVVRLAETPDRPLVIHGVQHVFHPPATLAAWPDDDTRTRLVFITRDVEPRAVRELFAAFLGDTAPDRPDRTALLDSPLTPFGGRDA